MKKLFISICLAVSFCSVFGQVPADTGALRTNINTNIVANGTGTVTAVKLNNIFNAIMNLWGANITAISPLIKSGAIFSLQNSGVSVGSFNTFRVTAKGIIDSAWNATYPNTAGQYQNGFGNYQNLTMDSLSGGIKVGQTTLIAGTKAITIAGITSSNKGFVSVVTENTAASTKIYRAVCTTNTVTITALTTAGNNTTNTADISVVNYWVY